MSDVISVVRNLLAQLNADETLKPIATAVSTLLTHLRVRRLEQAAAQWKDMKSNREFDLNTFATEPAGVQLLIDIAQRIELEHSEKKRERFANLIFMSWICEVPPTGFMEEATLFADATSVFTEAHVLVLLKLCESIEKLSFKDLASCIAADSSTERDELAMIVLFDLCSRFVFARRGNVTKGLITAQNLSAENLAFRCMHQITNRGRRYVDMVIRGPKLLVRENEQHEPPTQIDI